MIIQALLDLILALFEVLTLPIDIPDLPNDAVSVLETAFSYIVDGAAIISRFTNFNYLITLLGIVLAVDVGLMLYKFVMFIIKKIPFFGIK